MYHVERMNMKHLYRLLLTLIISAIIPMGFAIAEDTASALQRVGQDVAELDLGFGDYVLGQKLDAGQQLFAKKNKIAKSIAGTIKFHDGDIYVVVQSDTFMVLGLYKQYSDAKRQQVKNIVGELMLRFNEPTTMAHDKLIYWAYSRDGLIAQDDYDAVKTSGDADIIATVKLSSTAPIFPDSDPNKEEKKDTEEQTADIYVIIASNPLSKIFLAEHQ
jgi:hypothetical protein